MTEGPKNDRYLLSCNVFDLPAHQEINRVPNGKQHPDHLLQSIGMTVLSL